MPASWGEAVPSYPYPTPQPRVPRVPECPPSGHGPVRGRSSRRRLVLDLVPLDAMDVPAFDDLEQFKNDYTRPLVEPYMSDQIYLFTHVAFMHKLPLWWALLLPPSMYQL